MQVDILLRLLYICAMQWLILIALFATAVHAQDLGSGTEIAQAPTVIVRAQLHKGHYQVIVKNANYNAREQAVAAVISRYYPRYRKLPANMNVDHYIVTDVRAGNDAVLQVRLEVVADWLMWS